MSSTRVFASAVLLATVVGAARAGDVATKVKHGTLKIVCSTFADSITLDNASLLAGQVRITPGAGTTVDGSSLPRIVAGVKKDVIVNLNGANVSADSMILDHMHVPRDLRITIGAQSSGGIQLQGSSSVGRDLIVKRPTAGTVQLNFLEDSDVKRDAIVGLDTFFSQDASHIGGELRAPDVHDFFLLGMTVDGRATIGVSPSANNSFVMMHSSVAKGIRFRGGPGNDEFSLTDVETPAGGIDVRGARGELDAKLESCTIARGANITGGGDSAIEFDDSTLERRLDVTLGKGTDSVTLKGSSVAKAARVDLGAGNNVFVAQTNSAFAGLAVDARGGNDQLALNAITTSGDATFRFGSGQNLMTLINAAIGKDLFIQTGADHDVIQFTSVTVSGKTKIHHGAGNDVVPP